VLTVLITATFLASCGGGSSSGGSGSSGGGSNASLSLLVPSLVTMLPGSAYTVSVTAIAYKTTVTPAITSAQFPAGVTITPAFPLSIPSAGTTLTLQTSASIAAGTYTVILNGEAGTATATAQISITVQTTNLPAFYFDTGLFNEVALPIGGSGQIQVIANSNGTADFNVILSAEGLPPGTTATFNPPVVFPGNASTVTLTANATAPFSQNVNVTITGTPQAPIAAATTNFLASVTAAQNALPNNRSDYVSTDATPYGAVYDSTHGLIFSSNNSWNRVDVISTVTHSIVQSVSIRDPRGIDISQDNSTVWVATGSQQVFAINTTTFAFTRYQLPSLGPVVTITGAQTWQGRFIYALADGTLMIYSGTYLGNTLDYLAIWNPATNSLTALQSPANAIPGVVERSGDGKKVYSIASDSSGNSFYYDDVAQTFSGILQLGGYAVTAAVNFDGSRVAVYDASGLNMYDGSLDLLGPLPGGGLVGGLPFEGGLIFEPTSGELYETSVPTNLPVLITIDPNSLQVLSVAPAMAMAGGDNSPDLFISTPFAVDTTGIVMGLFPYGICFDDSTFAQNFATTQPGFPAYLNHMAPYVGPLAGGTTSGGFGNAFNITPGVWYGKVQGIASNTSNDLTITSSPSSVAGPVNIKFIFPDGVEVFNPLFFSYGPMIRHAVLSGASPDGGAAGQIAGFGLPSNSSGGTLAVGGVATTIANPPSVNAPTTGAPFPTSTILSFTIPAGAAGNADVTVNSPNGRSTLPKAIFYGRSVTDYPSPDTFIAVLYDGNRQQLYLSAGDHIDVFSLTSDQFVTPLEPAAIGNAKLFSGLALTPDGSLLLASDLLDGSLAVINPDNPATSYAISVAPSVTGSGCTSGPTYVASGISNQAFVLTGALPGAGCGPGNTAYQVNLSSRSSGSMNAGNVCVGGGTFLGATNDGTTVVFGGGNGFCSFNLATQASSKNDQITQTYWGAISGDGNVATSQWTFLDTTPNVIGRVALPDAYFIGYSQDVSSNFYLLRQPELNDSGSLYFLPYPNFFDIVDVQHGTLRMRFSLNETVSNTALSTMAIDSGGRFIYLLTNKGLTVVDLGQAPLSIGSLSQSTASAGTQITIRGSGFTTSTTATVDGNVASVNFTDENTLTLTVPATAAGPADVILQNSDGTTYTLESALTVN
jgi:hypothetical protein